MDEDLHSAELSILHWKFWDLWLQKALRNLVSLKFWVLVFMGWCSYKGLFLMGRWVDGHWESPVSATIAFGLIGGGFVTVAVSRVYVKVKLKGMDTDFENGNGGDGPPGGRRHGGPG